jgi:hypothetical protein
LGDFFLKRTRSPCLRSSDVASPAAIGRHGQRRAGVRAVADVAADGRRGDAAVARIAEADVAPLQLGRQRADVTVTLLLSRILGGATIWHWSPKCQKDKMSKGKKSKDKMSKDKMSNLFEHAWQPPQWLGTSAQVLGDR